MLISSSNESNEDEVTVANLCNDDDDVDDDEITDVDQENEYRDSVNHLCPKCGEFGQDKEI